MMSIVRRLSRRLMYALLVESVALSVVLIGAQAMWGGGV